jgi:hypothetical protein
MNREQIAARLLTCVDPECCGFDEIEVIVREAVESEREACAKVCERLSDQYQVREGRKYPELKTDAQTGSEECAAEIRARGEKTV